MKREKVVLNILILFFCAAFLFAAVMFIGETSQRRRAQKEFDALADFAVQTPAPAPTVSATMQPDPVPTPEYRRNIAALQERNSHCIGWVSAPGTGIDYPVMHTPHDPQFYLRRNFDRRYSVAGTPFLDGSCTLESENLVIYGHNMNDESMFADLHDYLDEDFRREHSVVEFETTEGCAYYEVVDVRKVDMYDGWYDFGKKAGEGQYLTLSTCDNGNDRGRVILIAKRVK